MNIKLLTSRAGADFVQNTGDEITVSDAEAIRMIEAGQAVAVRQLKTEKATRSSKKARSK